MTEGRAVLTALSVLASMTSLLIVVLQLDAATGRAGMILAVVRSFCPGFTRICFLRRIMRMNIG